VTYIDDKGSIAKARSFCKLLHNKLPEEDKSFTELIYEFDTKIKGKHPNITREALSNAHGDWYEWLLAISAWNYFSENSKSYLAITLPNIRRLDVSSLYINELYNQIKDLREKIKKATSVNLVTSNPDFVILDPKKINLNRSNYGIVTRVDEEVIDRLNSAYLSFVDKCGFEGIVGYLSSKLSFRPDRRLQIAHEGSLIKALYIHLQTRQWIISPKGLKYYAAAAKVKNSDREALKTVATHSITTVHDIPSAAVDEVFKIDSITEAYEVYNDILIRPD